MTAYCPYCRTLEPFTITGEPQLSTMGRLELAAQGAKLVVARLECGHLTRIVTYAGYAA